jgi:hypothetical protein
MGRPAIVKVEEVEKLCAMQCTQAEIASFFGVSKQAIEKRIADEETLHPYTLDSGERVELTFREIMDLGYSKGKISQRRALLQAVQAGNVTAMIWFAKQYMGQRDAASFEHSGPGGGPLLDLASVEAYVRAAKPEGGL